MQIKWTSVEDALPDAGKTVYVSDGDTLLAALAHYVPGVCWQHFKDSTQQYSLGRIVKWCEVEHAEAAMAASLEESKNRTVSLSALEKLADEYFVSTEVSKEVTFPIENGMGYVNTQLVAREAFVAGYAAGFRKVLSEDAQDTYKSVEVVE